MKTTDLTPRTWASTVYNARADTISIRVHCNEDGIRGWLIISVTDIVAWEQHSDNTMVAHLKGGSKTGWFSATGLDVLELLAVRIMTRG